MLQKCSRTAMLLDIVFLIIMGTSLVVLQYGFSVGSFVVVIIALIWIILFSRMAILAMRNATHER